MRTAIDNDCRCLSDISFKPRLLVDDFMSSSRVTFSFNYIYKSITYFFNRVNDKEQIEKNVGYLNGDLYHRYTCAIIQSETLRNFAQSVS